MAAGVGASWLLPGLGCGGEGDESPTPTPAGLACGEDGQTGWVELSLEQHPALSDIGGWTAYANSALYLDLNVAHVAEGEYVAAWRICPHGACFLEYEPAGREFTCPCHGSRFGEDGALLEGPATRGLRTYPACRSGGSVWIGTEPQARRSP